MAEDEGMYRDGLGYALWCLFFVGAAGIHRIYLGKYGTGILWLLTGGLFGIGQFVDLFRMKTLVQEANIRAGYLPHPRLAGQLQPSNPPRPPERPLKHRLLDAALEHGGVISVTEGVAATGASFEAVESTLMELVETGYVDIDNAPDTGVIVYRFVEISR
ncbi:MAG: NINE protein [Gemmatimonadota bacterium]